MLQNYQVTRTQRLVNWLVTGLLRLGVAANMTYLLTVKGRFSGKLYSTPVNVVAHGRQRWLVAPYGAVNWVLNARAAGEVTLSRGRRSETVKVVELGPEDSAPVLMEYVQRVPITRPYFVATPHSPVSAFAAEAGRHPVFRVQ